MNNKANFDYLKLQGAQVRSMEINGKVMNCIVIPVDWNGIYVTADKDTGAPVAAHQNTREWETSQKYKEACIANNVDKEGYLPPSHQIQVSYPEELEKAYKKRLEAVVRADEKFMATNPSEEDIKKQVSYRFNDMTRIGYVTPLKKADAPAYTATAPMAQNAGAYVPPSGEVNPGDDLPF